MGSLAGKYHRQAGVGTITYGDKGTIIRRVIISKNLATAVVTVKDGPATIAAFDAGGAESIGSYELGVMTHLGAAILDVSVAAAEATLVTD